MDNPPKTAKENQTFTLSAIHGSAHRFQIKVRTNIDVYDCGNNDSVF